MYPEALEYLTCPQHPEARLTLHAARHRDPDGAIVRGRLRCPACGAHYRIRGGVADLLGPFALPNSPAQFTNYLPLTAWAYERIWRPRSLSLLAGAPLHYSRELPLVAELVAPARGGLFVDLACSNGLYARSMQRARTTLAGHVIGIDHSMPMLRQARAFARTEGLRISYVRARAQKLPFATGSAAGLAMGGSLNEIGNVDRALGELRRTLAPNGRCVMMCLVQGTTRWGRALQAVLGSGGVAFLALPELNCYFARAGLRLRAQWQYRIVVFSLLLPALAE